MMQKVMKTENGQGYFKYDMIFMLGGLWQVVQFLLGGTSMIIDSHAHYNNNAYKKPFRYLSYGKDGFALREGELLS